MWLAEVTEREEQVCAADAGIQMMVSSWGGGGTACPSPELWEGAAPDPLCPLAVTLIFM